MTPNAHPSVSLSKCTVMLYPVLAPLWANVNLMVCVAPAAHCRAPTDSDQPELIVVGDAEALPDQMVPLPTLIVARLPLVGLGQAIVMLVMVTVWAEPLLI